jgi:hypothetical protein
MNSKEKAKFDVNFTRRMLLKSLLGNIMKYLSSEIEDASNLITKNFKFFR